MITPRYTIQHCLQEWKMTMKTWKVHQNKTVLKIKIIKKESTNPKTDQTDKDKESYNNQDTMDPNNIAELNKTEVMEEEIIFPEEETDDQSQSKQESKQETNSQDNQADQESKSEKTNSEDLIQTQEFNNDKQTRTQSGSVSRSVFNYVTHHNHIQTQSIDPTYYTEEYAKLIATTNDQYELLLCTDIQLGKRH
jgi:hypothetical protein